MSFLSDYAEAIIAVSVLSVIFEMILPAKRYRKYITMVIGLIIMSIIISPISIFFSDFEKFTFEKEDFIYEEESFNPKLLVVDEFRKNLEAEIEKGVEEHFLCDFNCRIEFTLNDNGEILQIDKAEIYPYTDEIANFIHNNFGVMRDKICEVGIYGD